MSCDQFPWKSKWTRIRETIRQSFAVLFARVGETILNFALGDYAYNFLFKQKELFMARPPILHLALSLGREYLIDNPVTTGTCGESKGLRKFHGISGTVFGLPK